MIDKMEDIPKLPQVSMELIRYTFQEEPDIQKIASIIEMDPTLTAKLFRTVNSAAFGTKVEVTSVSQAVATLGLNSLKSTVVAIAVGEYFLNDSVGNVLDGKQFCIHSLATGTILEKLAQSMGMKNESHFYLVGLLHDLGVYALDFLGSPGYGQVMDQVENGVAIETAEKEVFGIHNRQAWIELAHNWQFPSEICSLFKGEIGEVAGKPNPVLLIREASRLADTLGYSYLNTPPMTQQGEEDLLSMLDESTLFSIGQAVKKQVDALSDVLNLPLPEITQVNLSLLKITKQLSAANVENIRNRREMTLRITLLEELTRVSSGITRTLHGNSQAFSFSVLEALMEGFHVDAAFLFTGDPEKDLSGIAARSSEQGGPEIEEILVGAGKITAAMKTVMNESSVLKVTPTAEDRNLMHTCLGEVNLAWYAPIIMRGNVSGVIGVGVQDGKSLKFNSPEFGQIFGLITSEVGLSMENTRLYKHMLKEARYDGLTGILNRRTIMKVLIAEFARFKRKGIPLTVAIFDLDHFKAVNDHRGHLVGDDYLKKMAQILKGGIRETDYIGRYGGDEFIAVFPDTEGESGEIVVERIRQSLGTLCNQFTGADLSNLLSVSVGISSPDETMTDLDQLIKQADSALYSAKAMGRDRCVLYNNMVST